MWQIDASRFRSSNERPGLEAKRSRSTIFTAKDCRLERWTHRLRSKRESFSTDSKTHTVSHCPFRTRLKWSRMFINYSYCNQLQSHRIRVQLTLSLNSIVTLAITLNPTLSLNLTKLEKSQKCSPRRKGPFVCAHATWSQCQSFN